MKSKALSHQLWALCLWVLAYFAARYFLDMDSLPAGPRVAIALVPVPFFALFLWQLIRAIRGMDELERRVHLEALAVAFPLSILLIMLLGLLELAMTLNRDDWSYRHIWPLFFAFYFLGLSLARRRYS